jgi:hypothetical protein
MIRGREGASNTIHPATGQGTAVIASRNPDSWAGKGVRSTGFALPIAPFGAAGGLFDGPKYLKNISNLGFLRGSEIKLQKGVDRITKRS